MSLIKSRRWLTPKVIAKIRELMATGWGNRKIAKQLKKDDLCDKGPTTIWSVMCEIRAEDAKKLKKDDTVQRLETKVEIHETTERIRQKGIEDDESRQRKINSLYLRMAETHSGRKELFTSSPQEKLKIIQHILGRSVKKTVGKGYRSILKRLENFCERNDLLLDKTLSEAWGSQAQFEEDSLLFDDYLANQISDFLDDQAIQKKFFHDTRNCPKCGKRFSGWMGDGHRYCRSCGQFSVLCPCGQQLKAKYDYHYTKEVDYIIDAIEKGTGELRDFYVIDEYVLYCSCGRRFEIINSSLKFDSFNLVSY